MSKAFLSHQSRDKPFVTGLATCLRANGIDVFLDTWDIAGGDSIPAEIEAALSECDLFLYVLSPAALSSKWVEVEYHAFLYRKLNDQTLRIIPILRETALAPPLIAPLKALDFRAASVDMVCDPTVNPALRTLLEAVFRTPVKPPLGAPHPSLASYEFYFQPMKSPPAGSTGVWSEMGFKNLSDAPLHNFQFTVTFRQPVEEVVYDFARSTANMTGGDELSSERTRFNWFGNQIAEDGGWVVFNIRSANPPAIARLSTKLLGRVAGTNRLIHPDPAGVSR
jgi:hypothetical protein